MRAVAEATGIPAATLRVWERRYGRPRPERSAGGQRRYRAEDVLWLRQVAEGLRGGHRAGVLLRASPEELKRLLGRPRGALLPPARDWLAAALALDGERLRALLQAGARGQPLADFCDRHLGPFLAALGAAWAEGRADIRHEHLASETVRCALDALGTERARARSGAPIVLATPAGELHALGLAMLAAVLAEGGRPALLLGPDVPPDEIARAAREARSPLVAVSVSLAHAGLATDRGLAALARELPAGVRLVAGGAGARAPRRGRAFRVHDSLVSFARALAAADLKPPKETRA
jgi:DNA-binding transcriptional MerR regulator/methylmalonyl-CoA mutase cobalamin-binding subunit